jgi:hypothetical protein
MQYEAIVTSKIIEKYEKLTILLLFMITLNCNLLFIFLRNSRKQLYTQLPDQLNAEPNPYLARKKDTLAFFLQLWSHFCNQLELDLSYLLFSEKMQIIMA